MTIPETLLGYLLESHLSKATMYRYNSNDDSDLGGPGFSYEKAWKHLSWQLPLKLADLDLMQFLNLYQSLKDEPDYLNKIAYLIKTKELQWMVISKDLDHLSSEKKEDFNKNIEALIRNLNQESKTIYSLHRNLALLMIRGLLACLTSLTELLIKEVGTLLPAHLLWPHAQGLRQIEQQAILGFACQEMGDWPLCVYHCKHMVRLVSESLKHIQAFPGDSFLKLNQFFKKESSRILFDIREIALQTIQASKGDLEEPERDVDEDETEN